MKFPVILSIGPTWLDSARMDSVPSIHRDTPSRMPAILSLRRERAEGSAPLPLRVRPELVRLDDAVAEQVPRPRESFLHSFVSIIGLLFCCLGPALLAAVAAGNAQNPDPVENPAIPTVTFNRLWEVATPQLYTITARSTGSARYVSSNPVRTSEDPAQAADPDYTLEFTLSAPGAGKVFALATQAKYFDGDFDYKHRVANTGAKTLTYADLKRHFQTTYNWSENAAIDQLTSFFEGVSGTIEHGRKLQFLHRYDKLGLEAHLKAMEDEAQSHYLAELQIIAPVLESIANDSSVMNIARQRARRLLQRAKDEATSGVKKGQ